MKDEAVTTQNVAKEQALVTEDMSFMDEYAGQGLDTITSSEQAGAYLGLIQPNSQFVDDDNKPGTWRNSATGTNYGSTVRVIPVAFRTIWSERENTAPYRTVARYEPNSIEVDIRRPPAGKRGYPKMFSKTSGYEIQELYVYACILPDFPSEGIVYFNPTVGSMRACKAWNSQLKGQVLPNGKPAPIFGYSWYLTAELVDNPQQPNTKVARFTKLAKDVITDRAMFDNYVKPQLVSVQQNVLAITSNLEADGSDNN